MKKICCCFKRESSGQEPPEYLVELPDPPEPSELAISDSSEESVETVLYPLGNNEFTDDPPHQNLDIPGPSSYPRRPSPPPISHLGVTIKWSKILKGTENLRNIYLLGEGSFGEVYRCDLPPLRRVGAVKIQKLPDLYDHPEYVAELTALHVANHPNVIKLLGKCFELHHCAIVYEFMPNGSLDHHLYANTRPGPGLPQKHPVLNWAKRVSIAVGVAEALVYLHTELKTIHRDVKVKNVLLDDFYVPKLSGFGSATKLVEDKDGVEQPFEMDPIKGSPGYIAPETESYGLVSTKSDVYSYGVFLLTLFTGLKAYDFERPIGKRKLTDLVLQLNSEVRVGMVSDVALGNRYSPEGIESILHIARVCTEPEANLRPCMGHVESRVRAVLNHEVKDWSWFTERWSM